MNGLAALKGFIDQHNISMQVSKVNDRRSVPEARGIDRYRCSISRPGKQVNVYVAVPPEEGRLTPSDVLFMLILDASGCEMLKDYYGLHEQLDFTDVGADPREFNEFWDEYESRCKQTRRFRAFLGDNLYEELVGKFGFDN